MTAGTGAAADAGSDTGPCGCPAAHLRAVRRLPGRSGHRRAAALSCGARGTGMIRLFESGNEASAAVLATALYQALPADEESAGRPGGGRKLLAFSDSRQAAAFFAPYLESSHALVQQRRLILDGLARATASRPGMLGGRPDRGGGRHGRGGRGVRAAGVQAGAPPGDRPLGDAGTGRARRTAVPGRPRPAPGRPGRRPAWRPPAPLLALGLAAAECWLLLAELVRTLRLQGALSMPEEVDPADEMFDPRRGPIYVRGDGAEARLKVLSWLPTRGVNRRLDYLRRCSRCWAALTRRATRR